MAALVDVVSDARTHPGSLFTDVLNNALGVATAKLSSKVDEWTDRLNDVASGTAKQQAVAGAVAAGAHGKNPLWAALKAAWSGGDQAESGRPWSQRSRHALAARAVSRSCCWCSS